ncbi:MAG: AAA family ATPase [Eubacterium ventriosum]
MLNYRNQTFLLLGPTGSGKTYLAQTLAKILMYRLQLLMQQH